MNESIGHIAEVIGPQFIQDTRLQIWGFLFADPIQAAESDLHFPVLAVPQFYLIGPANGKCISIDPAYAEAVLA